MPRQRQPSKTQVTFRIPIETLNAVRAEANAEGETMSEVLRSIWDLRCRIKRLAPNQRLAIVDTVPIVMSNGHERNHNKVIEYISLKGLKNGRS